MRLRASDPALLVPGEPYPGLRPFLEHEAPLLQGRESQIDEVRARLAASQFVAVVGGSGCGKSSLIRAGVVPDLRARGLSGFGNYWVPVVFTPGTAELDPKLGLDVPDRSSPLTRLAWKFGKVLSPIADEAEEAERQRHLCDLLRRGGLRRLVDTCHAELPRRGPDTATACFLFVVDQFEELFHRTNQGTDDARLVVEMVISHFFRPHPRCAVVITMRSENLADCAAFLELPDAINRSMYLVPRLDQQQLRAAIVGPASFYRRMRERAGDEDLPDAVRFDDAVVDRLLADVEAISGDPDHLPLLQHVLARTWEAACDREGRSRAGVPHSVQWSDLERGCLPAELRPYLPQMPATVAHDDRINTLRVSLEHWAWLRYHLTLSGAARPQADRDLLDALLLRLGYRHPDSGVYLQNRFELGHTAQVAPGQPDALERIRSLVNDGFLNEVSYLFWDGEDPKRETLKVSHEAFIRGWSHFSGLLNIEADRFEEFKLVYRRCLDWVNLGRRPAALLSETDIGRIDAHRLDELIARAEARKTWLDRLRQARDGANLARADADVALFLGASRSALKAARDRQRNTRRFLWGISGFAALLFIVTAVAMFVSATQRPAIESVDHYAAARMKAERANEFEQQRALDNVSLHKLGVLLQAAQRVDEARRQDAAILGMVKQRPGLPLVGPAGRLPYVAGSESYVNAMLREHLTTSLWRIEGGTEPRAEFLPEVAREVYCWVILPGAREPEKVLGSLVSEAIPPPASASAPTTGMADARRRLFIPDPGKGDPRTARFLSLHHAGLTPDDRCEGGPAFWSEDRVVDPRIAIDARLRYMGVTLRNTGYAKKSGRGRKPSDQPQEETHSALRLYEFVWSRGRIKGRDTFINAGLRPRKEIHDRLVNQTLQQVFETESVDLPPDDLNAYIRFLPTWREAGGYGFVTGKQRWRLLDNNAQRLPDEIAKKEGAWKTLSRPANGAPCDRLESTLQQRRPGVRVEVFAMDSQCLEVTHHPIPPKGDGSLGGDGLPAQDRDVITIALYDEPNFPALQAVDLPVPTPVAAMTYFDDRRRRERGGGVPWRVGVEEPYVGWVGLWEQGTAWAAPLTTEALALLGRDLCRHGVEAERKRTQNPQRGAAVASTAQSQSVDCSTVPSRTPRSGNKSASASQP